MKYYYRISIKTSSFDTYLCITSEVPYDSEEIIRHYFDNPHSPLLEFFTKKWVNKVAADLKQWKEHPDAYSSIDPSFTQPIQYRNDFKLGREYLGFKYWLSINGEDGDANYLKQSSQKVALVIVSNQVKSLGDMMPYDALFGEATGLPWCREFPHGDSRLWFGMKKIERYEYLVWRKPGARTKEHSESSVSTVPAKQRDLPLEILYLILPNLVGVKTDMIPTILCCRLVNRTWYQIASRFTFSNITILHRKCRFFLNSPKKTILPFLRTIQLLVMDPKTAPNETDIVDIVCHSPQLELFVIQGNDVSNNYCKSNWMLYVIGWPAKPNSTTGSSSSTPLPPSDLLERTAIKDLETRFKPFETEAQTTKKKTELYFFCLAPPSNTFLAGLTHILNTLVRRASGAAVGVRFEGFDQWPFSDALDWLERKHEWIIEHWPKQVFIIMAGKGRSSALKFVNWELRFPFPRGNIKNRIVYVNKDIRRY